MTKIITILSVPVVILSLAAATPPSYTSSTLKTSAFVNETDKSQLYKVDIQSSKITWLAKKVTGEHSGTLLLSDGTLEIEKSVLKGASFLIDTRSITNSDITDPANNAKLIGHLKSDDFFAVGKYPTAKLVITQITPKGDNVYDVKANLTIKGITNEVQFPATVLVNKDKLTANAKLKVDRTKYDIKFRSKSFFENLGDKVIYDDFDLDIALTANVK